MATTYTALLDEIAGYTTRGDVEQVIPLWITFAEADFNRRLQHRKMVARKTATLDSGRVALPADWLSAINIEVNGRVPSRLAYLSPSDLDKARDDYETSGIPLYYTLIGDEIEVAPHPSGAATLEMLYRAKLPALSIGAPTNWLLTDHPDLYLFGALSQALPWMEGDPRAQSWVDKAEGILAQLNTHEERSRFSGGPLVRRLRTFG
jgi:hypothetical protein